MLFARLCKLFLPSILFGSLLGLNAPLAWSAGSAIAIDGQVINERVSHGLVAAYGVDESGYVSHKPLATGTTNSLGQFSILIPGQYAGPLRLTVRPHPDKKTLATCSARKFCGKYLEPNSDITATFLPLDTNKNGLIDTGEQYAISNHYELSATLPLVKPGGQYTVYVTPLTDVASRITDSIGRTNSALIIHANRWVARQFDLGFNILSTRPLDIFASQPIPSPASPETHNGLTYALLSSAFREYSINHYNGDAQIAQNECGWSFSVAFLKEPGALHAKPENLPPCYADLRSAAAAIGDDLPNIVNAKVTRDYRRAVIELNNTLHGSTENGTLVSLSINPTNE